MISACCQGEKGKGENRSCGNGVRSFVFFTQSPALSAISHPRQNAKLSSRSASPDAVGRCLCSPFPPGFPAVPHHLNHTSVVADPSQNRAGAIHAHGSSHSQFTENSNILTLILGSGRGKRFSISQNFCQLRQPRLPRRFSHLNSSFFTSSPNRAIPRRLSVTP